MLMTQKGHYLENSQFPQELKSKRQCSFHFNRINAGLYEQGRNIVVNSILWLEHCNPSLGPEIKMKVGHFSSFGWVLVCMLSNQIVLLLNISRKHDLNGACSQITVKNYF